MKDFSSKRQQHYTRLTVHHHFTFDFVFHIVYVAPQLFITLCSDERLLLKTSTTLYRRLTVHHHFTFDFVFIYEIKFSSWWKNTYSPNSATTNDKQVIYFFNLSMYGYFPQLPILMTYPTCCLPSPFRFASAEHSTQSQTAVSFPFLVIGEIDGVCSPVGVNLRVGKNEPVIVPGYLYDRVIGRICRSRNEEYQM